MNQHPTDAKPQYPWKLTHFMSLYDSVELVISHFINWPSKCETRGCNIPVAKSTALDKPIAVFTVLLVYIKIYRPKTKQSGS